MTGIARGWSVGVTANIIVFIGEITGIVMLVTLDATKGDKVAGGGVALNALVPLIVVATGVDWEVLLVVIEIGIPIRRRVTVYALLWIALVVIGIGRVVEIRLMAEPAIGGSVLELAVHVTGQTSRSDVRTGQREVRCAVIEIAIPIGGVVALRAVVREVI